MRQHLKEWHQCQLVNYCGKDWAVSDQLQDKLLVHYRRQEQAVVLSNDVDASTAVKSFDSLPGKHYIFHAVCDHHLWSHVNHYHIVYSGWLS